MLRPWLFVQLWCSFRPADRYKNLQRLDLIEVPECHFRVAAPIRTPLNPHVYVLVPRRGEKPLGFFTVFVFFNFAIIILTLFAQIMVSKASATNYDA